MPQPPKIVLTENSVDISPVQLGAEMAPIGDTEYGESAWSSPIYRRWLSWALQGGPQAGDPNSSQSDLQYNPSAIARPILWLRADQANPYFSATLSHNSTVSSCNDVMQGNSYWRVANFSGTKYVSAAPVGSAGASTPALYFAGSGANGPGLSALMPSTVLSSLVYDIYIVRTASTPYTGPLAGATRPIVALSDRYVLNLDLSAAASSYTYGINSASNIAGSSMLVPISTSALSTRIERLRVDSTTSATWRFSLETFWHPSGISYAVTSLYDSTAINGNKVYSLLPSEVVTVGLSWLNKSFEGYIHDVIIFSKPLNFIQENNLFRYLIAYYNRNDNWA